MKKHTNNALLFLKSMVVSIFVFGFLFLFDFFLSEDFFWCRIILGTRELENLLFNIFYFIHFQYYFLVGGKLPFSLKV